MVNTNELYDWVLKQKKNYPHLAEEMQDLFQLCMDEIEEGSSISNEIYLCEDSIKQLTQDEEDE
jgi:hypothetical protein